MKFTPAKNVQNILGLFVSVCVHFRTQNNGSLPVIAGRSHQPERYI